MWDMDALYRVLIFLAVLCALALVESIAPVRSFNQAGTRWIRNFCLLLVGNLVTRLVFPLGVVGAAIFVEQHSIGLMPLLGISGLAGLLCCFVLLDLAIYLQHRLMHVLPWLWRLHSVHHRDLGFDVSTGIRFHPLRRTKCYLRAGAIDR
jgi:sterol desaturase/sphingolipid hydroxylase (fatty acid hydroxylase superfamily)